MKAFICDQCGERTGFEILRLNMNYGSRPSIDYDFCSYKCLAKWVELRILNEEASRKVLENETPSIKICEHCGTGLGSVEANGADAADLARFEGSDPEDE